MERAETVFAGLKVADFTWVAAGPIITQYLADHGAMVVRVESVSRPDILRIAAPYKDRKPGINRSGYFARFNSDKYSLSLNLNHPRGVEVAKRLVAWSEVVVENFTPGTMERWGLGYEELRKINPNLIMLSTTNQGQTGPHSRHPGHGGILTSLAGYTHLAGWPDAEPCQPFGALTDFITPWLGATVLIAALEHRRRTGEGQYLDLSQYEASLLPLTPLLLDYFVNGREWGRNGNRAPDAAPHGAYPCAGDDRWCVIAVETEVEWRAFCRAISQPELADVPRFSSLQRRKEHEDELDGIVAAWTRTRRAEEAMETLQRAGVAVGVVQTPADLFQDPQLKHRCHFQVLEHAEIGKHSYEMPPCRLSRSPAQLRMPAPCLGQHNEYVCREVLKIPEEEFIELLLAGVLE